MYVSATLREHAQVERDGGVVAAADRSQIQMQLESAVTRVVTTSSALPDPTWKEVFLTGVESVCNFILWVVRHSKGSWSRMLDISNCGLRCFNRKKTLPVGTLSSALQVTTFNVLSRRAGAIMPLGVRMHMSFSDVDLATPSMLAGLLRGDVISGSVQLLPPTANSQQLSSTTTSSTSPMLTFSLSFVDKVSRISDLYVSLVG